jgi:hypothetical protein
VRARLLPACAADLTDVGRSGGCGHCARGPRSLRWAHCVSIHTLGVRDRLEMLAIRGLRNRHGRQPVRPDLLDENLLLVVDQFEEIFRFFQGPAIASSFVSLCLPGVAGV